MTFDVWQKLVGCFKEKCLPSCASANVFPTLLRFCHCRLPFYYELKIAFVVWLLSPYTKGSSVLYRKFVHPTLSSKEKVKSSFLCGLFLCFLWCTQGKVFSQGFQLISMFLCLMCANKSAVALNIKNVFAEQSHGASPSPLPFLCCMNESEN